MPKRTQTNLVKSYHVWSCRAKPSVGNTVQEQILHFTHISGYVSNCLKDTKFCCSKFWLTSVVAITLIRYSAWFVSPEFVQNPFYQNSTVFERSKTKRKEIPICISKTPERRKMTSLLT